MLPRAIAAALQFPKLEAADFTATKFDTAEEKTKFGNHLLRFIVEDYPTALWTKVFYNRLHLTFSNIAHYNQFGFWETWYETAADQIGFLENIAQYPCWGDPAFTYSDVEEVIKARVKKSEVITWKQKIFDAEHKKNDLAELARLKAKYETQAAPAGDPLPAALTITITQSNLFS